jgi:dTDP-4-amino-4,6-dideoxygalactose transaminase
MPLLGWKYNMDNIQAALLLGQLERIDELWHKRDVRWKLYEGSLGDIRNISWMKTLEGVRHARHLFTVLVPPQKRDQLLWALQQRGIGVAVNYRPIHLLKYYRENFRFKEGDFPVAEEIGSRTISLPLYPDLSQDEIAYVVQVLNEELNR